jgi:hypothetical protein
VFIEMESCGVMGWRSRYFLVPDEDRERIVQSWVSGVSSGATGGKLILMNHP